MNQHRFSQQFVVRLQFCVSISGSVIFRGGGYCFNLLYNIRGVRKKNIIQGAWVVRQFLRYIICEQPHRQKPKAEVSKPKHFNEQSSQKQQTPRTSGLHTNSQTDWDWERDRCTFSGERRRDGWSFQGSASRWDWRFKVVDSGTNRLQWNHLLLLLDQSRRSWLLQQRVQRVVQLVFLPYTHTHT